MNKTLHHGDCLDILKTLPDNSVDSIVTDPPYGLSFMGKKWDYDVPSVEIWTECLRVLKPGGHLLAFAGTRTQHRMAVRIEDAGFEIRDILGWMYASGMPKSHDVAKAVHAQLTVGGSSPKKRRQAYMGDDYVEGDTVGSSGTERAQERKPAPAVPNSELELCDEALRWNGWGTALKPAFEPITVARKPLAGTVAENVLQHGTGALNIDACRVPHSGEKLGGGNNSATVDRSGKNEGWQRPWMNDPEAAALSADRSTQSTQRSETLGRWPANLIHDGSSEVLAVFPDAPGQQGVTGARVQGSVYGAVNSGVGGVEPRNDVGSAARFFYCAKASKSDRGADNSHPTVKPTNLMRYLCRLVTPPNGTVLDPFMGSGSTGVAALLENFNFIGIEREAKYHAIATARIESVEKEMVDNTVLQDSGLFTFD